jgi:membrane protease YdiL (CAAX protease family)
MLPLEPEGPVAAAAMVLAVDLLGISAVQLLLLPYFYTLSLSALITPSRIWIQAVAFILLGLAGVGFPLRRGLGETLERLGIGAPRGRRILLAAAAAVAALLLGTAMEWGWQRLDPAGFGLFEERFGRFFEAFQSLWGLLTVGLAAGIGEEILYRGAIQPKFGLAPTAILFAVIHSYYGLTPAFAWIFILGLGMGYLRRRTDTTTCIIFHAAYNMLTFYIGTR